jgi:hypothetical protein
VRRSSHNSNPSARSADAPGFSRISAVQWATQESIASKTHLNEEKKAGRRSRQSSRNGHLSDHTPIPTPNPAHIEQLSDLAEVALSAMNELSDSQTALIVEQLYGEGFEWGLSSSNIDVTSPEEPCSFQDATFWRLHDFLGLCEAT